MRSKFKRKFLKQTSVLAAGLSLLSVLLSSPLVNAQNLLCQTGENDGGKLGQAGYCQSYAAHFLFSLVASVIGANA